MRAESGLVESQCNTVSPMVALKAPTVKPEAQADSEYVTELPLHLRTDSSTL